MPGVRLSLPGLLHTLKVSSLPVARYRQFTAPKEKFPWLLWLALIAAILFFWGLPYRLGPQPVRVEFTEKAPNR